MKDLDISSTSDPPKFGSCILGHLSLLLLYCEGKKNLSQSSNILRGGLYNITSAGLHKTLPQSRIYPTAHRNRSVPHIYITVHTGNDIKADFPQNTGEKKTSTTSQAAAVTS